MYGFCIVSEISVVGRAESNLDARSVVHLVQLVTILECIVSYRSESLRLDHNLNETVAICECLATYLVYSGRNSHRYDRAATVECIISDSHETFGEIYLLERGAIIKCTVTD